MKAIGIDLGTTGISGILLDAEKGYVLKSVTKNSNAFIASQHDWEKIQDVEKIIRIAKEILDDLICSDVCAIGVTGQMHGIVYYDKDGSAVSDLYIWQDGRGNLEYNGTTYAEYLKSFSGYGCVTDFYNKVNGLVPKSSVGFCTVMDYFVMKLCNNEKPLIHTSNAASFGCYDLETNKFTNGYTLDITKDFTVAGKYKGIPVSVAIGDNQASVLSSLKENELLINVGTGSQVSKICDKIFFDDNIETRPYFENKYLIVGSALCGGRAYSLMKDFIKTILVQKMDVTDEEVYDLMENIIKDKNKTTIKADTRFAGTRADKNVKGGFSFVTTENFTPSEFVYSVLYGMSEELYLLSRKFVDKSTAVIGSGNGLRKNKNFIQIAENMFESKINIPRHKEEASFGAALFALVAVGQCKDIKEAQMLIKYQ